jgi:hypothetical protein
MMNKDNPTATGVVDSEVVLRDSRNQIFEKLRNIKNPEKDK